MPNAFEAPLEVESLVAERSAGDVALRIPRPPPPAFALSITG
jgi:hypothetical protein